MSKFLIKNAKIVNEGVIFEGDVLIENEYIKIFDKVTPNKKEFFSQENVFERGMYAFVRRNLGLGDKQNQATFEEKKALIEQNIDRLLSGDGKDIELGNIYKDVYNKILADSKNIGEVDSKIISHCDVGPCW